MKSMATRSEQLQIRVTRAEKAMLKKLARSAGLGVSSYVLGRALPSPASVRFRTLLKALRKGRDRKYVLAELGDLLVGLAAGQLREAVADADLAGMPHFEASYVAAMVDHVCTDRRVDPPRWTSEVEPLPHPWFATELVSLRSHLIKSSPVEFKRRNLFVDSTSLDRV